MVVLVQLGVAGWWLLVVMACLGLVFAILFVDVETIMTAISSV